MSLMSLRDPTQALHASKNNDPGLQKIIILLVSKK